MQQYNKLSWQQRCELRELESTIWRDRLVAEDNRLRNVYNILRSHSTIHPAFQQAAEGILALFVNRNDRIRQHPDSNRYDPMFLPQPSNLGRPAN